MPLCCYTPCRDPLPIGSGPLRGQCAGGFDVMSRLSTSDMGGTEPFGFIDGISQPQLDWGRRRPAIDKTQLSYTNLAHVSGSFCSDIRTSTVSIHRDPSSIRSVISKECCPRPKTPPIKKISGATAAISSFGSCVWDVAELYAGTRSIRRRKSG